MYEWIVDNEMTPYILVDTGSEQVQVPRQFEEDGKIILNISPRAVQSLELGHEAVSFDARFGDRQMGVVIPVGHVLAIYAHENGDGMAFPEENTLPPPSGDPVKPDRARLRVVK